MTYQFEQKEEGEIYDYEPEEECVVLLDMVFGGRFKMRYEASCSECGNEVAVNNAPEKCPTCDRDIVDWRSR